LERSVPMWRMPRQQFWREALTLSAVAMLLLLIEMLGRLNRSETFDAASGLVLILAVAMTVSWHRRLRLRWTGRLALAGRRLWKSAQCWRFEWGLDLRREPPVPRGVPPALCVLPLSLLGLCIAAVIWAAATGMPLRVLVVQASYVVYAAGLMTLWVGCCGASDRWAGDYPAGSGRARRLVSTRLSWWCQGQRVGNRRVSRPERLTATAGTAMSRV